MNPGRRVTLFGLQPHSPHLETQLELMQDHHEAGDAVTYVTCDRALTHCDADPGGRALFCRACVAKRRRGLAMLSFPVRQVALSRLVAEGARGAEGPKTTFPDTTALAAYRFEGWDCGEAVLSSLYSWLGHRYPALADHQAFVHRSMLSTVAVHRAARHHLRIDRPDRVYLFNGRSASSRPILRACQQAQVAFACHERGAHQGSYMLAEGTVVLDVVYRGQEMVRHWHREPDEARKRALAERFYARMQQGKLLYRGTNYLKNQVKGTVPSGWQRGGRRVVFFTSSEPEITALNGFFPKKIYTSLRDALNRICGDLRAVAFDGQFVIRMHPNSRSEAAHVLAGFHHADAPFVSVILPDEPVDSYALLAGADRVLVAASTIGMEAAFAGIPAITLERANYDRLGATHDPQTHDEVMALLCADQLPPLDRQGAYLYGYYTMTFGRRFRHVTMQGDNKCAFRGRTLRSPWWLDQLLKWRRHPRRT